jgi:hypothetical protein
MKTKKSSHQKNGHGLAQDPIAKAAAAQKIVEAARKHLKLLKAEHKHARKAFKQAKKAAKRARKEAKAAAKLMKSKNGGRMQHQKVKSIHRRSRAKPAASRLRNSGSPVLLRENPAPSDASIATA